MKAVVFLRLVVLSMFWINGRWSGELEEAQKQVRSLEAALQSTQTALAEEKAKTDELGQILATVQQERDQAVAARDTWQTRTQQLEQELETTQIEIARLQARVQDLERTLQTAQSINAAGGMQLNAMFQPNNLGTILATTIVLVIAGYSGLRSTGKLKQWPSAGHSKMSKGSPETTVVVRVPQVWMPSYAKWLRQMQSAHSERLQSHQKMNTSSSK